MNNPYEMPQPETMSDVARAIHEWYSSLIAEGFTKSEAMHIIMNIPCCKECKE